MNRTPLFVRRSVVGAALAVGLVCMPAVLTTAADKEDEPTGDKQLEPAHGNWMEIKLANSKQILEDLTTGDLEAVSEDARRMRVMNVLEQWLSTSGLEEKSDYRQQLNLFEFSTKELIRHADDGNVDGALDSYVNMTRTCVECHKVIRDR